MLQKNRILLTIIILLAIMAAFLGLFVAQHMHSKNARNLANFHGTLLKTPRSINAFSLIGMDGQPFTNGNLKGHWTMVFFGYTSCASICPTTMVKLAAMYRLLEEKHIKNMPQVLLVSLDPEQDDIARLERYVTAFHPQFFAARGEEDALNRMSQDFGIAYAKVATALKQGAIEHTGTIVLLNPEGKIQAFFTMPHRAKNLAQDYLLLVV